MFKTVVAVTAFLIAVGHATIPVTHAARYYRDTAFTLPEPVELGVSNPRQYFPLRITGGHPRS